LAACKLSFPAWPASLDRTKKAFSFASSTDHRGLMIQQTLTLPSSPECTADTQ
jgi:hypothetical protein